MWGCESPAPVPLLIAGEEHWRCPRRPILDQPQLFGELFWMYRQIEQGILPDPGGIFDQANQFVECWAIIDSTLSECYEEKARQARRSGRGGGWPADRRNARSNS